MKSMTLKSAGLAAFISLLGISCSNDGGGSQSYGTLLEVTQERADISTFSAAVELAGLTGVLESGTDRTLFAPTNNGMDQFLLENGYTTINAVPVDVLKEIVYNHFVQGSIETSELTTGYKKTFARGSASASNYLDVFVNTTSGIKLNGVATVTTPNIPADNGVLHIVDKVVGLPTIVTHIGANPELTSFATALAFDPSSNFIATLSDNSTKTTVFAPDNTAFSAFLTETGNANINAFPATELHTILLYHTVNNVNTLSSSFSNGQNISTAAGQGVTISLTGGGKKITDVNGRISNFIKTDIQASNGVVHIVDKALLPNF